MVDALTPLDLQRRMTAADPAIVLLPPRWLRHVIWRDRHLAGFGLHVPHRKSYVVGREKLRALVPQDDAPQAWAPGLPETVLLLAAPPESKLARWPAPYALRRFWRLAFHARIDAELGHRPPERALTRLQVRDRIHQIGQTQFDEVRAVLRYEDYILPPEDDREHYIEFAAVYLELRHFAPSQLPYYFPSLKHQREAIDAMLAEDVDVAACLRQTRPEGTADLTVTVTPMEEATTPGAADPPGEGRDGAMSRQCGWLLRWASSASRRGNHVRAAILTWKAAPLAPAEATDSIQARAEGELKTFAERLRHALDLPDSVAEGGGWRLALRVLLKPAAVGFWNREARLLYDLQKICVDAERNIIGIDPWGWFFSLGRRPLRRALPLQRLVLASHHLHAAAKRLRRVRLPETLRAELAGLVNASDRWCEHRLRETCRPPIAAALADTGFVPTNAPERVGFDKIVEELLDDLSHRGFLSFGLLRDAISRNPLKLPNLASAAELVEGDRLLRADRRLATALDGVYRPGEIYLRWLQRFSSLTFGTPVGRFITLYLALPFGGAYVILEGIQHTLWHAVEWLFHVHGVHLATWWSTLGLGAVLYGVIHSVAFRQGLWRGIKGFFALLYQAIRLPIAWTIVPAIEMLLKRDWLRPLRQVILQPLLATILLRHLVWPQESIDYMVGPYPPWGGFALTLALMLLLLNSRPARRIEVEIGEAFHSTWHRTRKQLLPGLIRGIIDLFKQFLEAVEQMLYAVDEQLRFRTGESKIALAFKAMLIAVWSVIAYFVRAFINLVVEPQLNPIKHFPVVTVSHKLMIPIATDLMGRVDATGKAVLGGLLFSLPGTFGFLAWELLSNWRLYGANRGRHLRTIVVGSHGETVAGLLQPGFHSGTLPKLYSKLRKAERRRLIGRADHAAVQEVENALHHVAHRLRDFIKRFVVRFLAESPAWSDLKLVVDEVSVSSNRIGLELHCPGVSEAPFVVACEEQSGWLVAGIERMGFVDELPTAARVAFRAVLIGVYKAAGVELVRQQIEAHLWRRDLAYDIGENGLVVWDKSGVASATYDLDRPEDGRFVPQVETGFAPPPPTLQATQLLFSAHPLEWDEWLRAWSPPQSGLEHLLAAVHVFPPESAEPTFPKCPQETEIGSASY